MHSRVFFWENYNDTMLSIAQTVHPIGCEVPSGKLT